MPVIVKDCPHCPATRSTFEIKWVENFAAPVWLVTATCAACRKPITAQVRRKDGTSASPNGIAGAIEPAFVILNAWPDRKAAGAPAHTPLAVARRFLEGESAYERHSWNAAVAMYRSALDIGTKALDGVPQGQTFFKRLEWLHDNHRITPDMRSWADQVRIDGNDALHDPEEFTEADAKPLRLFTEMFLRYVFELPGEVDAFRSSAVEADVIEAGTISEAPQ